MRISDWSSDVCSSDLRLLAEDAVAALRDRLVPIARMITPNLPEAGDLLHRPAPATPAGMLEAARELHRLGVEWVLLKGGNLDGPERTDLLHDGRQTVELPARRIDTRNTHGTGCTLSAAIAA